MLANPFGQFVQDGRAFAISNPATPMPWVNVISNGRYGLVVSQNGGGFSFYDDAQHNVLTRWEMDLVRDCYGKFLYLADLESGAIWSGAPQPCGADFDRYTCTHGLGFTTFDTRKHGIDCEWTISVAPEDPAEVWAVKLTNTGSTPRKLRVSSWFEWCCGVAPDAKREFHRLFFNTRYDAKRRAMVVGKNMWDIPRKSEKEHWNVPWPYMAAHAVHGAFEREIAIGDKSTFLGKYGNTATPAAMRADAKTLTGGFGRFCDSASGLGGDLTIAPGQSVELHWVIAVGDDEAGLLATLDRYADANTAKATAGKATAAWQGRLGKTSIKTSQADFDLLNNHWLPYQAISGRLWGRTGYYQQSGAFGFRDQLQDSQVWLPIDPAHTLKQIMLHAERQFSDGSVYHWWHALADFGNHTACSDDYLWLPFLVAAYIRETGDVGILNKTAPFIDSGKPEGSMWFARKQGKPTPTADPSRLVPAQATIAEHCRLAIARAFERTSGRGLPFIGSCDWNDGLSAMGVEEKGESVWLGQFLCHVLEQWSVILRRVGDGASTQLAETYAAKREAYRAAINQHAWDETGWYRYGTKDNGEWIGAPNCQEGKIHLNAQTWSILAETGTPERNAKAWGAVKQHLLSPYGPLLLFPAYTIPDTTIGYVTRYSPGSRENGGVYMHAATWALAAAAKMKDQAAVGSIWKSVSPATRGQNASAYWAEPYVTPGNVDGPLSDLPGRAGWTWYTGSAAWLNRVSLEWVLGIRPVLNPVGAKSVAGLLIDPCPPVDLGRVTVKRTWRGRAVRITFDAAEFKAGVSATVTVNGRVIPGGVLQESDLEGTYSVSASNGTNGSAGAGVHSEGERVVDVVVRWLPGSVAEPTIAGGAGVVGVGGGAVLAAGTRS